MVMEGVKNKPTKIRKPDSKFGPSKLQFFNTNLHHKAVGQTLSEHAKKNTDHKVEEGGPSLT